MTRLLHIARRVLIGLLALVVVLAVGLWAFAQTDTAKEWLREEARIER